MEAADLVQTFCLLIQRWYSLCVQLKWTRICLTWILCNLLVKNKPCHNYQANSFPFKILTKDDWNDYHYNMIFLPHKDYKLLTTGVMLYCQAQPQLNLTSTQSKSEVSLNSTLSSHPATRPPGHPATHPTTRKSSFQSLLNQLEIWNFTQKLTRPTWLR